MKIIDLLNKIANGEEVPNAIKFNDIIYKKADVGEDYYNFTINKWFFKDVFDASGVNLEVEILEEEKKIPEKLEKYYDENLEEYAVETYIKGVNYKEIFNSKYDEMIISKLNEVLDYLKSKGE